MNAEIQSCNDFEALRRLGSGSNFGQVYLVRRLIDGALFAVEEINLNNLIARQRSSARNPTFNATLLSSAAASLVEIGRNETLLKQLEHKNIIRCFGSFLEGDNFHLVLEFCENGTFRDAIKDTRLRGADQHFREVDIQRWARQLVSALAYLHTRHMSHRAILAKNTFLTNNRETAKLGTFGLGNKLPAHNRCDSGHSTSSVTSEASNMVLLSKLQLSAPLSQSSSYMPTMPSCTSLISLASLASSRGGSMKKPANIHQTAQTANSTRTELIWDHCPPEVLRGESHSAESDMWLLGLLFYEITQLKSPFSRHQNSAAICEAILNEPPDRFDSSSRYSFALRSFIERLLEKTPEKRQKAQTALTSEPFLVTDMPLGTWALVKSSSSSNFAEAHECSISDSARLFNHGDMLLQRSVCSILKRENLCVTDLLDMNAEELAKLFVQRKLVEAVLRWREVDLRRTPQRLMAAIRRGDLLELSDIARSSATRRNLVRETLGEVDFTQVPIGPEPNGDHLLHYATRQGRLDVVKFALARFHASLDARNRLGDMAIHIAVGEGHLTIVAYFLEIDLELLEAEGYQGQTPLLRAASVGCVRMLRYLLGKGAEFETSDQSSEKQTVLHLAAASGSLACCQLLIDHDQTLLERKNGFDETPLWYALRKGNVSLVNLFISRWAQIESRDRRGRTPLHQVCSSGNLPLVRLLIEKGADVMAKSWLPVDVEGYPIHLAAFNGHVETLDILLRTDYERNKTKPMLEQTNRNGDTPLWRAAFNGQWRAVQFLIGQGANIEARGQFGSTPLLAASARGHVEAVRLLLEQSANFLAKDSEQGAMAIHLAAAHGHVEVVTLLLDTYPQLIDEQDDTGLTALAYARFRNKADVAKMLRNRGARKCELVIRTSTEQLSYD